MTPIDTPTQQLMAAINQVVSHTRISMKTLTRSVPRDRETVKIIKTMDEVSVRHPLVHPPTPLHAPKAAPPGSR